MIRIHQLNVTLDGHHILHDIEICFEAEQVHGIIGLNGAGKTTLLNTLFGTITPQQGDITWKDQPLSRTHIGFLETNPYYYSNITGREYVQLFAHQHNQVNVAELGELFKLPLDELISHYSTGMKRKLSLIALLCLNKDILILDEPFNGLDLESSRLLELTIQNLIKKKKTILITSHILENMFNLCDSMHLIQNGSFVRTYRKETYDQISNDLFKHLDKDAWQIIDKNT